MASEREIKKLQTEFPDLSQSVLGDVLTTYKNDKEKAASALRGIGEDMKRENEKKIKELQDLFPNLSREIIAQTLESTKGDVESTIAPLFNKSEEITQNEKKKVDVAHKKKKEQEVSKKEEKKLRNMRTSLWKSSKVLPRNKCKNY